jgi:hypothetical protein
MADGTTKHLLRPFVEMAPAPLFLSGFFVSPPENFHTSETVEIDVQRDGEDVAIAIHDISTGSRHNENSIYSNKEFKPPIFSEEATLQSFLLLGRDPGENPYGDIAHRAKAVLRSARVLSKMTNKIRRAVEWQASQIFQTGQVQLIDGNGNAIYSIDYQPKPSHFVTVQTSWATDGQTGDPIGDITALGAVIRRDGKRIPRALVFGDSAWSRFIANPKVQQAVSRDGIGLGALAPERRGAESATFQGFLWATHYRYELWTYDGSFTHPQTKEPTPFVGTDRVIMLSDGRLDLTYGAVPTFASPDQQVLPFLPGRVSNVANGLDYFPHGWIERGGKTLCLSVSSRPLCIPTEIDSFGCLDVVT